MKKRLSKERDPSWRLMEAIRRSGAGGAHKDKIKLLPRREKHKAEIDAFPVEEPKDEDESK